MDFSCCICKPPNSIPAPFSCLPSLPRCGADIQSRRSWWSRGSSLARFLYIRSICSYLILTFLIGWPSFLCLMYKHPHSKMSSHQHVRWLTLLFYQPPAKLLPPSIFLHHLSLFTINDYKDCLPFSLLLFIPQPSYILAFVSRIPMNLCLSRSLDAT